MDYRSTLTDHVKNQANAVLEDASIPPDKKEEILHCLVRMDPNHAEYYLKLAQLTPPQKSQQIIMWLRLAYEKKPNDYAILYPLCKSLFMKQEYHSLVELNKNHALEPYFEQNPEFLYYYFESKMALNLHKDCDKHVASIEKYFKNATITGDDTFHKWKNFTDCAKVHSLLGNIETSAEYIDKAIRYATKQKHSKENIVMTKQYKLCITDYQYYDPVENYKQFVEIKEEIQHDIQPFVPRDLHHERIRVGYVTSDVNFHAVCNFLYPILQHSTKRFDVYVFINQTKVHPMFQSLPVTMVPIYQITDKEAAERIYDMQIDILIDLNGHTNQNRIGIFPYRPAAVQMTYMGYPNTTGLTSIQYRITDGIADAMDTKQIYSETLLRMKRCFLLYQSIYQKEPIVPRKTNASAIILGSLNKETKNTPETLRVWSKIMRECPNTKLLIKLEAYDNQEARLEYYMKALHLKDKKRLLLIPRVNNDQYIRLFSMVDIVLDTFPYSGTTTTCNSLYNSIPVVTLYHKDYHVHNVSASVLVHAGCPELVAYSEKEYVDIIRTLLSQPEKIDDYKANLHTRFMESMKPAEFMKEYEDMLETVYQKHTCT